MIKTGIIIWLAHGPTLNEFLSHLEQESDNIYFYIDGSPCSHFNWSLESLKSDNKFVSYGISCQLVGLPMLPRNSLLY